MITEYLSWVERPVMFYLNPGFIGFTFSESAEDAFVGMNGTKIEGKAIKIDFPGRKLPVSRLIVKNLPTVGVFG